MPYRATISVTVIACLLAACNKSNSTSGGRITVDLSSPKAALKTYGEAMKQGDASAAEQAVTGIDPKAIEALAELGASRNRLEMAAVAKFGEAGKSIAGSGHASYGDTFETMLDGAEVTIDGDIATVVQKSAGSAQTEPVAGRPQSLPLKLKRIDGNWKVDYAAMPNTRHLDLLLPIMTGMIKANDEMAAEIKDGKYTTADDAKNAHLRLLNAVLRPAVHSGLRDSTQPATSGSGK